MKKKLTQLNAFMMKELDFRRRHWQWTFLWLFYDLMWAMSIGFLGSAAGSVAGLGLDKTGYIKYLLVGSFMWTYLASCFITITWAVVRERWEGTIEYTFMAPVQRGIHLAGTALFAVLFGVFRLIVVFAVSALIFGLSFSTTNILTAAVLLAIATIPFVGLGVLISVFPLLDHENGDKVPWFAEAIIMMILGIYYPIAIMPLWLQYMAQFSPLTYALAGMRQAVLENANLLQAWPNIWPLIIAGIVLVPLGLWGFGIAERYAKQTGKLKRDG